MVDERLIILRLVESGKVTAEEAAALLDALGGNIASDNTAPASAQVEQLTSNAESKRLSDDTTQKRRAVTHGINEAIMAGLAGLFAGSGQGIEITETIVGDLPEAEQYKVTIETKNGSVVVKPWENPGYKVVAVKKVQAASESEAQQLSAAALEISAEAGRLKVSAKENSIVRAVSISVFLPADRLYDLAAETRNGGVSVGNLRCGNCHAGTTNGGINISHLAADGIFAESTNGGIRCEDVQARRAQAETTNGGIRWQGAANDVRLETTNGSIKARPQARYASGDMFETQTMHATYNLESCNGSIGVDIDDIAGAEVELQAESRRGKIHVPSNMNITHQRNSGGSHEIRGVLVGSGTDRLSLVVETTHGSITVK